MFHQLNFSLQNLIGDIFNGDELICCRTALLSFFRLTNLLRKSSAGKGRARNCDYGGYSCIGGKFAEEKFQLATTGEKLLEKSAVGSNETDKRKMLVVIIAAKNASCH